MQTNEVRGSWVIGDLVHHGRPGIMARTHCGIPVPEAAVAWTPAFFDKPCLTCKFQEDCLRGEEILLRGRQAPRFLKELLRFEHQLTELCSDCGAPLVLVASDGPYGEGEEWFADCPIEVGLEDGSIQGFVFDEATEKWSRRSTYAEQLHAHMLALRDNLEMQLANAQEDALLLRQERDHWQEQAANKAKKAKSQAISPCS